MHGIHLTWRYSARNRRRRLVANLRTLVVYYSRSGTTRKIAEALSETFNANIEEIVEANGRAGFFGYVRSLVEAIQKILLLLLNPKAIFRPMIASSSAHPCGRGRSLRPFAHI